MPPPRRSRAAPRQPTAPPLAAGPSADEAGGVLTINLGSIAANYRALARRSLPAECAAVVKADAYGCGLEQVTATLLAAGCKTFFVAHLAEARRVRQLAPEAAIYVLNGYTTGTGPAFAECGARPVINSAVELAEWDQFVATSGWRGGIALHVDTGINRLGLSLAEAAAVAPRIHAPNHGICLLMSHFACSEVSGHPLNALQIQRFRDIRMLYRGIPASLANSSGIFLGDAAHGDMVRPGAGLFGVNPTPGASNPMQPVVELKCRILQVRDVARDETVGYGATWTAKRDTRLAIIAAGYADGIPRAATATATEPGRHVLVGGAICPIVGRISMDLFTVDVTDLPQSVQRGDWVTLIGGELDIDRVAAEAGTIGYEILTSLGRRYHRIWTP
ncbi:MAG TPA: alanine racemase [Xanthobacteraceae bacterium]|nr:alanine racemase [Xanthobacteraceae bacterium]